MKIDNTLSWRDNHAMTAVPNAHLLGFQAPIEMEEGSSRGGRGGRGGDRGGRDGGSRGGDRGGRGGRRGGRGGKIVTNEDFPAL